jgi:TRAP-type C4-dicarboxylate transport system permease small subunit
MNVLRITAIMLIIVGILGLVYGSFTYTKETHNAKIGSIDLSIKEKETVNIPVWAGAGTIAFGSLLLLFGNKRD